MQCFENFGGGAFASAGGGSHQQTYIRYVRAPNLQCLCQSAEKFNPKLPKTVSASEPVTVDNLFLSLIGSLCREVCVFTTTAGLR